MPKVDEAKAILKALGLPKAQQSDKAAYTLLALTKMNERKTWRSAKPDRLRIHDVIKYAADIFRKPYAENTRADFRRRAIHQFERSCRSSHRDSLPALCCSTSEMPRSARSM